MDELLLAARRRRASERGSGKHLTVGQPELLDAELLLGFNRRFQKQNGDITIIYKRRAGLDRPGVAGGREGGRTYTLKGGCRAGRTRLYPDPHGCGNCW